MMRLVSPAGICNNAALEIENDIKDCKPEIVTEWHT